jgi:hypothetical protein
MVTTYGSPDLLGVTFFQIWSHFLNGLLEKIYIKNMLISKSVQNVSRHRETTHVGHTFVTEHYMWVLGTAICI